MTITNKMTGTVAFLGLIAVLDNFIFVEAGRGLDEMVLVEIAEIESETRSDEPDLDPFWIDRHEVSHADFAEFVAATGYRAAVDTPQREWLAAASADLPPGLGADAPAIQQLPAATASDNTVVQVSFQDAQAYCNWLGKALPSRLQVQFAARDGRDVDGLAGQAQANSHDREKSNVWMSIEHRKDAATASNRSTAAELLGFLCVKNLVSDRN